MMHTIFKKLTSLVLVAFMVLSMVPIFAVTANAAEGDQTYEKITSAPADWSGAYLIVYEAGNVAFDGSLATLDAASNTVSVTITDGKIIGKLSENTFTINADGNIQSKSGYYIGKTANSNGLNSSTSNQYTNTISFNEDGTVNIIGSGGAYLRFNAGSTELRFRYYKSTSYTSQKAITLYKLVDTSTPDPTEPTECGHTNTENVAEIPATCTTPGTTAGVVCSDCGAIISGCEEIAATGHTEVIDEAVDPTCTETGLTEGSHCSVCGETIVEQTVVPMVAHNYENGACTVCGEKQPTKYVLVTDIATLAEDSQIVIVYKAGNMAMGAQNNGNYREKVGITISENTFEYVDGVCVLALGGNSTVGWTLKASDGYLYYSGSSNSLNTGDEANKWNISISDSGIATIQYKTNESRYLQYNTSSPRFACYLGTQQDVSIFMPYCSHANTEEKAEVPATCTEDGREAGKFCNDCKTYIEGGAVIPALGHDWGEWVQTTAPGCETAGEETRSCARCDETETQPVEKLGHNWLDWKETKAPTCTETGEQTGTCSKCGETKTVEIPTIGHTYVDGTCSECGAEEPSASETSTATLSFASTDNRSSWTSTLLNLNLV